MTKQYFKHSNAGQQHNVTYIICMPRKVPLWFLSLPCIEALKRAATQDSSTKFTLGPNPQELPTYAAAPLTWRSGCALLELERRKLFDWAQLTPSHWSHKTSGAFISLVGPFSRATAQKAQDIRRGWRNPTPCFDSRW